jgi:tetraacyldisaccharide 4'-kinase
MTAEPRVRSWYAGAAALRRRYYAAPGRAAHLVRPVLSVGNLASGGRGKTPIVARIARLLVDAGERPAILSRGYARRDPQEGVTVVSDGTHVLADLGAAGDEPLMLARALPGVAVLVSASRAWAGALAERRLGVTVHLLDDGFQHVQLGRDLDLVVATAEDERDRPLPGGRLREDVSTLRRADALLVAGATPGEASAFAARWDVPHAFAVARSRSVPRLIEPWGQALRLGRDRPVVALAGIAEPDRFFDGLVQDGWTVAARIGLRDHQPVGPRDIDRLLGALERTGAAAVLTTEKDAVRLLPQRPLPMPIAYVPLAVEIQPADVFAAWLLGGLAAARARRAGD